jgi:hypothetical protein
MAATALTTADLTPPPFVDGLCDWSSGDGTPASPTYEDSPGARLIPDDPDFGDCLELERSESLQRLRYMGELPLHPGMRVEIRLRLKPVLGAPGSARAAAWPGGAGGIGVPGLPLAGRLVALPPIGGILDLRLVIARQPSLGVDLAWDARVLYAHVGVDLLGPVGGRVRIANLAASEIATPLPARDLPGFVGREMGGAVR